jgi:hypothetical protein
VLKADVFSHAMVPNGPLVLSSLVKFTGFVLPPLLWFYYAVLFQYYDRLLNLLELMPLLLLLRRHFFGIGHHSAVVRTRISASLRTEIATRYAAHVGTIWYTGCNADLFSRFIS